MFLSVSLTKLYIRTYMTRGAGGAGGSGNDPDKRKDRWDNIWGYVIKKPVVKRDNEETENINQEETVQDTDNASTVNQEAINTIVENQQQYTTIVENEFSSNDEGLIHYILTFGGLIDIRTSIYVGLGVVITGAGIYYIRSLSTSTVSQISNVNVTTESNSVAQTVENSNDITNSPAINEPLITVPISKPNNNDISNDNEPIAIERSDNNNNQDQLREYLNR